MIRIFLSVFAVTLISCTQTVRSDESSDAKTDIDQVAAVPDQSNITLGNGDANRIDLAGLIRSGPSLVVPHVTAASDSFLVLHPFANGEPVQTDYVGSTLISKGSHDNVAIRLDAAPDIGASFIIMLHQDVNADGKFQFGDGVTVADAPVFEGATMIASPLQVPASAPVTPAIIQSSAQEHSDKRDAFMERAPYRSDPATAHIRALAHAWLAEVEVVNKSPETARALLADNFMLNFPSGTISNDEALREWLTGPASSFAATRHVLSDISAKRLEPSRYTASMIMEWDGLTHAGERLSAMTSHRWIVSLPDDQAPRIERVDVEIIEPFAPSMWTQP